MIATSALSILFSGALIVILGARDPKRLRNLMPVPEAQAPTAALPEGLRRTLAWLVLLPGLLLACVGLWWAFLIWLGATCGLGWLTARMVAIGRGTH